ncbi:MAG: type II toxin-antitoxin system RelE/ParE family toxin [Gammaproteobacteria bacterium]
MNLAHKNKIEIYIAPTGKKPFVDWLESLKDKSIRYRIKERLDRVALGNLGDYKTIEKSVYEFRFDFGSGYRIYFGKQGNNIILLLCGGDKSSQKKDIKQAIAHWGNYLKR